MMTVQDFAPGARVRVQKNGMAETYDGTVVAPTERQLECLRENTRSEYVWVLPDGSDRPIPWRAPSLTLI